MFGFGNFRKKAIQQEIDRAQADIMNGRDTRRGRDLLGGNLTEGGYGNGREVGRPENGSDIRPPRRVK